MDYRILGAFEAHDGERELALGGAKQRALLAVLLLNANQVVSTDRLIDELWGEQPPASAQHVVQVYVSQLRKALEPNRSAVVTRAPGYLIRVAPGELDLERFERLLAKGREALSVGDAETAATDFRAALRLWRGAPLADFTYEPFAQGAISRLEELRLVALEERIEAELALGRHSDLVGELGALISEHPLRERFRGQLMLALYRSGRQAEALEVHQQTRQALVEELGIDPSPALQRLEHAILNQDPALERHREEKRPTAPRKLTPERSILISSTADQDLDGLVAVAEPLARSQQPHELILARLVEPQEAPDSTAGGLGDVSRELVELRAALAGRGVAARVAAFTSAAWGDDLARLASEQAVDLVLLGVSHDLSANGQLNADVFTILTEAPSDVAVCVVPREGTATLDAEKPVYVPFVGSEHDWAALELGAWIAGANAVPLRLLGMGPDQAVGKRDASRLLASASLAVQQLVGIPAEPMLVTPGAEAILSATTGAALVVVGLSNRWRDEGLGRVRTALVERALVPTLVVRRGLRPGGLAPLESSSRFTWSLSQVRPRA